MLRPKFTKPKTLSDNLTLQIIDWVSYDIKVENFDDYDSDDEEGEYIPRYTKEFIIRGYGVNENGNSVNINVKGFKPYFYIKLPFQEWKLIDFKKFLIYIQLKVPDYAKDYLLMSDCNIEEKKEFYGITNNKLFKFGKLVFKNLSGMYAFKKALLNDNQLHKFQNKRFKMQKLMYETKITPLLRFFHVQNIKPVGWVQINKRKYNLSNSISRCNIEINVNYKDVNPLNINKIGRLLVASFDIECTSIDGTFPQADRAGDEVIQIGTSIYEYGSNECGYNIWGFDEKYLYERAKTGCGGRFANFSEFFLKRLSRNRNVQPKYEEEGHKLSSSALGDNFLYYYEIEGIVQIDLFKVIQKDYNLESYKLDYVSQHFMKNNKVDLSPKQLFQNYREGTPDKIKEIAVYCIKDCILVNDLMNKLNVITNNVGMGNVCIVPLSYLFLRGQGIKIYSLVVKQCRDEGFLIKELTKDDIDTNGYEGAIVFVPEPGIYFEPVAVMDYASLYPSSMIEKEKIGYKICTFAEHKDGSKSVLPRILQNLLKARKDTRKTMKYKKITTKDGKVFSGLFEEDEDNIILKTVQGEKFIIEKSNMESKVDLYNDFEKAVLDGQQLAYKVTCNSVYGQVGASTSPICFKELAATIIIKR